MRDSMGDEVNGDGEAVEHGVHQDGDPEIGGAFVHVAEAEGEGENGEPDGPVMDEGKKDRGDDDGEPGEAGDSAEQGLEMGSEEEFFEEGGDDDCAEGDEDSHERGGGFVHD